MFKRLLRGFSADCRKMSVPVACLRVARTASLVRMPDRRELFGNPALWLHVHAVDRDDPFFYVSHRHYLARGLTRRQRVESAQHHYEHEVSHFGPEYFDAAYSKRGLILWHERVRDTDFEILLSPGSDVLYEGGMSVVLHVNGERVAVISYSYVDRGTIFEAAVGRPATTMFVVRKQLTSNHAYQRAFHSAFDRCTAAHFCFAALNGIAVAQGYRSLAAVRPEAQPSFSPERRTRFEVAYGRFWESMGGRLRGRFAYELPVPMALGSLDVMPSKARRRAMRRRAHLTEVTQSASDVITRHLRSLSTSSADPDAVSGVFPVGA